MTSLANDATLLLSIGIVVLNVLTVFLLFLILNLLFGGKKEQHKLPAAQFILKWGLAAGFIVSVAAILGSLFYSNVIGYAPCEFCWWIRILLYPQAIIFAVALWKKPLSSAGHAEIKAVTFDTTLILSILGALVAGYQYYGERFNQDALALCGASGVSCAKTYFLSFGYITLPFMGLSTFLFLIGVIIVGKLSHR